MLRCLSLVLALVLGGTTLVSAERPEPKRKFWPTKAEWKASALGALRDRDTWVPAAGAAVVAVSGWDDDISEWAREHTPVFGSTSSALDASDDLVTAALVGQVVTASLIRDRQAPWRSRFRRLTWQWAGTGLAGSVTGGLKQLTGRHRPDRSNDLSLPSGHATRAFAFAASTSRNLEAMSLSPGWRRGLDVGARALAAGTGWARVEGGVHYPTDVLVGAAVGNYVSLLVQDAFLHRHRDDVALRVSVTRDAVEAQLRFGW